jgi:CheY-like chemotaxis protein
LRVKLFANIDLDFNKLFLDNMMYLANVVGFSFNVGVGMKFRVHSGQSFSRRPPMASQAHVLVVDDEVLAAMALQSVLQRRGFRVSVAGDGQQALEIWNRDPADAVVTDLKMPRMTGDELAVRLRSLSPLLPLIVASGYLSETVEQRLRHEVDGPIEIFTKPINLTGVLRALSAMLARERPDQ